MKKQIEIIFLVGSGELNYFNAAGTIDQAGVAVTE